VLLTWKTVSEKNNDFFDVQVSANGVDFESLAKVKGAGNSNKEKSYNFNHENAFNMGVSGASLFYRLAQHDFDGKVNHSHIIRIDPSIENVTYLKVLPNPNNGTFTLATEPSVSIEGGLRLMNSMGEVVWQNDEPLTSHETVIHLNLPNGIYFLQTVVNETKVHVKILIAN
jgi:hypothetical protein